MLRTMFYCTVLTVPGTQIIIYTVCVLYGAAEINRMDAVGTVPVDLQRREFYDTQPKVQGSCCVCLRVPHGAKNTESNVRVLN